MSAAAGIPTGAVVAQGDGALRNLSIQPCNFRYAGRLSNENARTLTSLHEKFALQSGNSLEVYLGSAIQVRFVSLEQTVCGDYASRAGADNFLLPCALGVLESSILIELDSVVIYPMIDILLGGSGTATEQSRELTEIDEDIMEPVGALLVKELERAWKVLSLSLKPSRSIKPVGMAQVFPPTEKLVLLLFEITVAGTTGSMKIALPASFVGYLLRNLKAAQSKKISSLRHLPNPTLRERLLDGVFTVSAEQTSIRVLVRNLVDLRPGMVLRMEAPVKNLGRLTVEAVDIFESTVVRNGRQKAAQLLTRAQEPIPVRE